MQHNVEVNLSLDGVSLRYLHRLVMNVQPQDGHMLSCCDGEVVVGDDRGGALYGLHLAPIPLGI